MFKNSVSKLQSYSYVVQFLVKSLSSSNPKNVFWSKESRNHHSESAIVKTPFGKMPEWMTMQGMEVRILASTDRIRGENIGFNRQNILKYCQIFF